MRKTKARRKHRHAAKKASPRPVRNYFGKNEPLEPEESPGPMDEQARIETAAVDLPTAVDDLLEEETR